MMIIRLVFCVALASFYILKRCQTSSSFETQNQNHDLIKGFCREGEYKKLYAFIKHANIYWNASLARECFLEAAKNGQVKMVEELIKSGKNSFLSIRDIDSGNTVLIEFLLYLKQDDNLLQYEQFSLILDVILNYSNLVNIPNKQHQNYPFRIAIDMKSLKNYKKTLCKRSYF